MITAQAAITDPGNSGLENSQARTARILGLKPTWLNQRAILSAPSFVLNFELNKENTVAFYQLSFLQKYSFLVKRDFHQRRFHKACMLAMSNDDAMPLKCSGMTSTCELGFFCLQLTQVVSLGGRIPYRIKNIIQILPISGLL